MATDRARAAVARAEAHPAARAVLSVLIAVLLLCIAVTNLPQSNLRMRLESKTQPVLNAIGLDQNWGVFAPDPRRQVLRLRGEIVYADGAVERWEPPDRDPFIGALSDYRWRKYMENLIVSDDGTKAVPTTEWIARERNRSARPERVTLFKALADLPPPGAGAGRPLQFNETELVGVDIKPQALEGGIK